MILQVYLVKQRKTGFSLGKIKKVRCFAAERIDYDSRPALLLACANNRMEGITPGAKEK